MAAVPSRRHRGFQCTTSCQPLHFCLRLILRVIARRSRVSVVIKAKLFSGIVYTGDHNEMLEKFVNGSIVAFQGTSPNSRAAHPGQESPGNEGKKFVIISVLLTTAGIPTLSLAYFKQ